jgi:riboflavin synthase
LFTGIVAALGKIKRITKRDRDALLEVETALDLGDVRLGDSIAVSGVCLSVTALGGGGFSADVSAETLSRTTLRAARAGAAVNLEKALRVGDRLGGHFVLGHVDGVGRIVAKEAASHSLRFGFEIDPLLTRYIVEKGSIAVDGISLTVNCCEKGRFYVNIIPLTAVGTTLGGKGISDDVNIETDILAKHVEQLLPFAGGPAAASSDPAASSGGIDTALLARYGFLK